MRAYRSSPVLPLLCALSTDTLNAKDSWYLCSLWSVVEFCVLIGDLSLLMVPPILSQV